MGDEGLPVGNIIEGIAATRGLAAVPRRRLADAYLGRPYSGDDLLAAARADGFAVETPDDVAGYTAGLLAEGGIGAIFAKSMEMGPRALGGRSILASPADRGLNDTLNERLERTEFMPFAPYVLDEDARRVFDIDDRNWEACRFMTITTGVKEAYRPLMPAVVHVDHTARPQVIERETNPLYYDILREFRDRTGIPCLVNTSFNAHEEPIINTPAEALRALADRRVDFLVCEAGLVFPAEGAA
jgi:carbamoyltransferase